MPPTVIRLAEKLAGINEHWRPGIVATLNDYEIKLVKIEGEFVWHEHDETDELFLCLQGQMQIDFRDGSRALHPGELLVVPRGVEHRPRAEHECHILLLEPAGVVNTGDADSSELTAPGDQWL